MYKKHYKKLKQQLQDNPQKRLNKRISRLWEKGKWIITKEKARKLVNNALGKNCIYCNIILDIDNWSADHKVSILNGGLSTPKNLRIICKSCNRAKAEFNEDSFKAILKVANKFNILELLLKKLRRATLMFGRKKW